VGGEPVIVLDTHAWLWWVSNPELLGERALAAIAAAQPRREIFVSSISAWEVAMLVQKGRLQLALDVRDWLARCEALPFLRFVPVDNAIAVQATRLPGDLHGDSADRIIVATALSLGAALVTKDRKIQEYPAVSTLW
jgi:PIN domain nuclease of toxin-antitoxin system